MVNDGNLNSAPNNLTIMVISIQDAVTDLVQDGIAVINSLSADVIKGKNSAKTLTNKLNAVLGKLAEEDDEGALNQLQNDILSKTDGCAENGVPDVNDWITECAGGQNLVYPVILDAIELLQ
ncbi:hypothetical protein ACFL5V_05490 [Fibrobacterota bacterium]